MARKLLSEFLKVARRWLVMIGPVGIVGRIAGGHVETFERPDGIDRLRDRRQGFNRSVEIARARLDPLGRGP
jgi:hypothetical protein